MLSLLILTFYGDGGSFDACSPTQVSNLQLSCQLPFKKNRASFWQSNGASSLTSGYYSKGICDYSLAYVLLLENFRLETFTEVKPRMVRKKLQLEKSCMIACEILLPYAHSHSCFNKQRYAWEGMIDYYK